MSPESLWDKCRRRGAERDALRRQVAILTAERDQALGSAQNARLELARQPVPRDLSGASDEAFRVLVLDRFEAWDEVKE